LRAAKEFLAEHPEPLWTQDDPQRIEFQWYRAAMSVSLDLEQQRAPHFEYEIQVLRVGDAAFVGLPGEPFVEGQLRLKLESPAQPTYVVHATSHFAGYIPTRAAFAHGGHEVNHSWWAKLEPQALDMIVDGALELLREMFPQSAATD